MEPSPPTLRLRAMKPSTRLSAGLVLVLAVAACTGTAAGPSTSPSPSANPGPSGTTVTVDTAQAAFAAVRARTPWFDGVRQKDPNAIGAAQWWEATPDAAAWTVSITVGWGDCQAGCIDRHTWTWKVTRDGSVTFGTETGSVLPADQLANLVAASSTATGVGGRVTASPTCPVERPGELNCAPRPVAGAVLVVRGADGKEIARVTTDGSGLYRVPLQPGDYTLEPQAVEGILGTAPQSPFTVVAGKQADVPVDYDTGIR